MKKLAKILALMLFALLTIVLFIPVVTAQGSKLDESNSKPNIAIFYDHFSITNDSILHTDGDNVTVRLAVFMPDLNSWLARSMITSVYYNASWEKEQQIPLYTEKAFGPLNRDFVVPIGSQHLEIYTTGIIEILGMENGKEIVRTTYGNSTESFDITVAHPTLTSPNTSVTSQNTYDQNLLLLVAIIIVLTATVVTLVLVFRGLRKTAKT